MTEDLTQIRVRLTSRVVLYLKIFLKLKNFIFIYFFFIYFVLATCDKISSANVIKFLVYIFEFQNV